jgi:hypothetical protein
MKMEFWNRLILVATGHVAGYQIISGIEGLDFWPTLLYTVGFGLLVLICLFLVLLGFDILEKNGVVAVAALIPLSLSSGLVWTFFSGIQIPYLIFTLLSPIIILSVRLLMTGKTATVVLSIVHGIAGLSIVCIPVFIVLTKKASDNILFVSVGGALVGLGGLLLALLKSGKPFLFRNQIFKLFPSLLFILTFMFVLGLKN